MGEGGYIAVYPWAASRFENVVDERLAYSLGELR